MAKKSLPLVGLSVAAALFLTACGQEGAADYAAEVEAQARETLDERASEAREGAQSEVEAVRSETERVQGELKKALEAGDRQVLEGLITEETKKRWEQSGTADAWKGATGVEVRVDDVEVPDFEAPEISSVADYIGEDVSREDYFGDQEYVPHVEGVPYQDYEFSGYERPESVSGTIRFDGGEDRCLTLKKDDEGSYRVDAVSSCVAPFTSQLGGAGHGHGDGSAQPGSPVPADWVRIGDRSLADVFGGHQSGGPALIAAGEYEISLDDSLGEDNVELKDSDGTVDLSQGLPLLVATEEVVKQAREHVAEWNKQRESVTEGDSRCDFNNAELKVNGVTVRTTGTACNNSWIDHDKSELQFLKTDQNVRTEVQKKDYGYDLYVTFTADDGGPVMEVKEWDTLRDEWVAKRHDAIVVLFEIDESGERSLHPKESIQRR